MGACLSQRYIVRHMRESGNLILQNTQEHLGHNSVLVKVWGPSTPLREPWGPRAGVCFPPSSRAPAAAATGILGSDLLTLSHRGVYFHLKVNIQRLVAQHICLNNWGNNQKVSFKLVTVTS